MRIGELSNRTGVPVPTIKYYVREGLVPAGDRTDFNQTSYDESHVERFLLIKNLTGYGRLSLAEVSELFRRVFDGHDIAGATQALQVGRTFDRDLEPDPESVEWADGIVKRVVPDDKYGHRHQGAGLAFRRSLEQFPVEYRSLVDNFIDEYAEMAETMAELDIKVGRQLISEHDDTLPRHVLVAIATGLLRGEVTEAITAMGYERAIMDKFWSDDDFEQATKRSDDE